MAASTQDYMVKAGDSLRSVAKNLYGDENMYGFLQNNGITKLTPGQTIKAPVMAANPRGNGVMQPNPRDAVANSGTAKAIVNGAQPPAPAPVVAPAPTTTQVGNPNAPAPGVSFGGNLAKTPAPNQNVAANLNVTPPMTTNGQRPQLTGGDQSFKILEGLKSGTIDANQAPVSPAEKEGFQMYQSYQKYGNADAKTLFNAIQNGELTPDPSNVLWRAISQNGQATPAMAQAFAWWDDAVKRGATGKRAGEPFLAGQFPDKVGSIEDANALVNQDAIEGEVVAGSPSDSPTLAAWQQKLNDALSIKAPDTPNYSQSLTDYRAKFGVTDMEADLNDLQTQYADLEAQSRQRQQYQLDQPVTMNVIAGRMSEVQRQDNEKLDFVKRQMDSVANRIQTANSTIDLMMKTKEMDYNVAKDQYATQMDSAVKMMDQLRQINKDELDYKQEAAKNEQTNARANLQVYYNALQSGGMDPTKMTNLQAMQIGKLEMQSGLPVGTFLSLRSTSPSSEVKSTTERYDKDGNKFFDMVMLDKYTGAVTIQTIAGGLDAEKALDLQKTRNDIAMDPLDRQYKQAQINAQNLSGQKNALDLKADYKVEGGGFSAVPTISGGYGQQYGAGVEGNKSGKNQGVDFAVPVGTDVAVPPGNWKVVSTVTGIKGGNLTDYKSSGKVYGNSILLQNDAGEKVRLSHLSQVNVANGQTLSGGQVAGLSGQTGNTSGPHVDIEYYDSNGKIGDIMGTDYGAFYASGGKVSKVSNAKPTQAEEKKTTISDIKNSLTSVADSNGKISIDNYQYAKKIWLEQGYTASSFDDIFKTYLGAGSAKENVDIATKQVQDAAKAAASNFFK